MRVAAIDAFIRIDKSELFTGATRRQIKLLQIHQ